MDAKIHGQNWDEKQLIYVVSKYLPTRDLLITKGKSYIYSREKLANTTLTKRSVLALLASGTKWYQRLLLRCTKKGQHRFCGILVKNV